MVRFDGAEVLEEAKRLGRGGIIVSAHLGNWEFLGSGVSCLGQVEHHAIQHAAVGLL